jgi:hypothetical protein
MPALGAGIHVFSFVRQKTKKTKTWMAGTSPAMTIERAAKKKTAGPEPRRSIFGFRRQA